MGKGADASGTPMQEGPSFIPDFVFKMLSPMKSTAQTEFYQSYTDEPHATRRKEIIAKYPEIKELFGYCPWTKYKILAVVVSQILAAYMLQDSSWLTVFFFAYTFGGCVNHMMALAIHELSHNLGAKGVLRNRLLALFANLPMGIPAAITFKRYHMEHHRYQGEFVVDVDLPTEAEGLLFVNSFLKVIWVFLQPAFYALRPSLVNPKAPQAWELVNYCTEFGFDFLIYHFFGAKSLVYLIAGTLLGMGFHPAAGHFIAEHYVFIKGQETYSYYGPMNWVAFNVGYHNEHHDFPFIPGSRLPQVRAIASEYYDNLPHHTSWMKVILDYILDPEVGPFSRVKRRTLTEEQKRHVQATENRIAKKFL
jgi:sphingolipid delta-4 desaturase